MSFEKMLVKKGIYLHQNKFLFHVYFYSVIFTVRMDNSYERT